MLKFNRAEASKYYTDDEIDQFLNSEDYTGGEAVNTKPFDWEVTPKMPSITSRYAPSLSTGSMNMSQDTKNNTPFIDKAPRMSQPSAGLSKTQALSSITSNVKLPENKPLEKTSLVGTPPTAAFEKPTPTVPFDHEGALSAGYSQQEINDFLSNVKNEAGKIKWKEPFNITQNFGEASGYEPQSGNVNYGTDFATPIGTPVNIPKGNWQVIEAYNQADPMGGSLDNWDNGGYGNSVLLRNNDNGEFLRVSHLSDVQVQNQQELPGGIIGSTGASGHVTGPHVDVEYYDKDGNIQDIQQSQYKDFIQELKEVPIPKPDSTIKAEPPVTAEKLTEVSGDPSIDIVANATQTMGLTPEQEKSASTTVPLITKALKDEGINDTNTLAYALATIQHETAGTFQPIEEYGGREQARALGYEGGENYFGRGYIQLTHKGNYDEMGKRIGVSDLGARPEKALEPETAAKITAAFFKDRGVSDYTKNGDFIGARSPINGTDKAEEIAQSAEQWKQVIENSKPTVEVKKPQASKKSVKPEVKLLDQVLNKMKEVATKKVKIEPFKQPKKNNKKK